MVILALEREAPAPCCAVLCWSVAVILSAQRSLSAVRHTVLDRRDRHTAERFSLVHYYFEGCNTNKSLCPHVLIFFPFSRPK